MTGGDTTLITHSISQNYFVITFNLNNFQGTGTYPLGNETSGIASLYSIRGDAIAVISTDQHPYAGSIIITNFDSINRRCSGIFEFQIDNLIFSNGQFYVPLHLSAE